MEEAIFQLHPNEDEAVPMVWTERGGRTIMGLELQWHRGKSRRQERNASDPVFTEHLLSARDYLSVSAAQTCVAITDTCSGL